LPHPLDSRKWSPAHAPDRTAGGTQLRAPSASHEVGAPFVGSHLAPVCPATDPESLRHALQTGVLHTSTHRLRSTNAPITAQIRFGPTSVPEIRRRCWLLAPDPKRGRLHARTLGAEEQGRAVVFAEAPFSLGSSGNHFLLLAQGKPSIIAPTSPARQRARLGQPPSTAHPGQTSRGRGNG
jgi:hypothetical protein